MAAPWSGFCQDAFHSALIADQAYRARTAPTARQNDRLRAGPVLFGVGLSYSLEWTDNARTSGAVSEEDFIHRPQLDLSAAWPTTKDSLLSLGVGLGYSIYTRNSDLDSPRVNSDLAWDIPVRDFLFTLYDRFSYSQDVISEPALSGVAQFPRFDNTVGIRAAWRPDPWLLQAGYGHQNYFSDSVDFDYLNRSSEQFFARAGYQFARSTVGGLEASTAFTDYDSDIQSDNTSVSVGPFVEWQVTEAINLGLRGGYLYYSFQGSPAAGPASDLSSYYAGVDARHQLTRSLSHGLSASHRVQQSYNQGGRYDERSQVNYNVTWNFYRYASVSGDALYTRGREPQPGQAEEYDQVGFGLAVRYQFTAKLSSQLSYRHTSRNSNQAGGDYQVNQVMFSVNYRF